MITRWAVAAVVLGVVAAFIWMKLGTVSGAEARRLVSRGAILLDVRTPQEFAAGHVEGARNIPVQELDRRLEEVGAKDREVVVYCRSGVRSRLAKQMLGKAGYVVHDLGAMTRW